MNLETTIRINDKELPALVEYSLEPTFIGDNEVGQYPQLQSIKVTVTEYKSGWRKDLESFRWFEPQNPREFQIELFSPEYSFLLSDTLIESLEEELLKHKS